MDSRRILVTGGAGFIGSHLCEQLSGQGHRVRVIDNLSTGTLDNLSGLDTEVVQEDIRNREAVTRLLEDFRPEVVFHLAALASVPYCEQTPELAFDTNVAAGIHLLHESERLGVSEFYFASSAAVYGDQGDKKISEEATPQPMSLYGHDKLTFERYLAHFQQRGKITTRSYRFFNVFGPRQNPSSQYSGVLSIFLSAFLSESPDITIFGDGEQTRDFVYVKDVVASMTQIMGFKKGPQVLNIGQGSSVTLNEVIEHLKQISHRDVKVTYVDSREGDIYKSCADTKRLDALPIQRSYNFQDGLSEYFREISS